MSHSYFPFLELPAEVRNTIYGLVIANNDSDGGEPGECILGQFHAPPITQTNRQLRQENKHWENDEIKYVSIICCDLTAGPDSEDGGIDFFDGVYPGENAVETGNFVKYSEEYAAMNKKALVLSEVEFCVMRIEDVYDMTVDCTPLDREDSIIKINTKYTASDEDGKKFEYSIQPKPTDKWLQNDEQWLEDTFKDVLKEVKATIERIAARDGFCGLQLEDVKAIAKLFHIHPTNVGCHR